MPLKTEYFFDTGFFKLKKPVNIFVIEDHTTGFFVFINPFDWVYGKEAFFYV